MQNVACSEITINNLNSKSRSWNVSWSLQTFPPQVLCLWFSASKCERFLILTRLKWWVRPINSISQKLCFFFQDSYVYITINLPFSLSVYLISCYFSAKLSLLFCLSISLLIPIYLFFQSIPMSVCIFLQPISFYSIYLNIQLQLSPLFLFHLSL